MAWQEWEGPGVPFWVWLGLVACLVGFLQWQPLGVSGEKGCTGGSSSCLNPSVVLQVLAQGGAWGWSDWRAAGKQQLTASLPLQPPGEKRVLSWPALALPTDTCAVCPPLIAFFALWPFVVALFLLLFFFSFFSVVSLKSDL